MPLQPRQIRKEDLIPTMPITETAATAKDAEDQQTTESARVPDAQYGPIRKEDLIPTMPITNSGQGVQVSQGESLPDTQYGPIRKEDLIPTQPIPEDQQDPTLEGRLGKESPAGTNHEKGQDAQLKDLQDQNAALREQNEAQQREIETLRAQLQDRQSGSPQESKDADKAQKATQASMETAKSANGQTTPSTGQTDKNTTKEALDTQERNHPGSTLQADADANDTGGTNNDQAEGEASFDDMKNLASKLTTTSGSEREQILAQLLSAIVASVQALYNKIAGITNPQAQNQAQTDLGAQARQKTQEQAQNDTVNPSQARQADAQTQKDGATTTQSETEREKQRTPAEITEDLKRNHPNDYKEILGTARSMSFAKENGLRLERPTKDQMLQNGMSETKAQARQDVYDAAEGYTSEMEGATQAASDGQGKTTYETIAQEHDASRHATNAQGLADGKSMFAIPASVTSKMPAGQPQTGNDLDPQRVARELAIASENGMGMSRTDQSSMSADTFDKATDIYENTPAIGGQTKTTALDSKIAISQLSNERGASRQSATAMGANQPEFDDDAFAQGAQDADRQMNASVAIDPNKFQTSQQAQQRTTDGPVYEA